MSTYNGALYIREQINSILSQKNLDIHVLVRDDGSKDETCSILSEYVKSTGQVTLMVNNNIGCIASFCALAKEASENYPEYDYYAFSDQDDVWLDDKLYRGVKALEMHDSKYKLYASAYQMVDAELNNIPTQMMPAYYTFGEAMVMQPVPGCTMVFNLDMLNLFVMAHPSQMSMHDSWIYKVCLGVGGVFIYDPKPSILYRQHGNNVVGGSHTAIQRWKRRWNNWISGNCYRSKNAINLLSIYSDYIDNDNRRLLENLVGYQSSLLKKIRILFSTSYRTKRIVTNILFKTAILTNRY